VNDENSRNIKSTNRSDLMRETKRLAVISSTIDMNDKRSAASQIEVVRIALELMSATKSDVLAVKNAANSAYRGKLRVR